MLECLNTSLRHLPSLLLKDVLLLPELLEKSGESESSLEEMNNEALELMISLMTRTPQISELFKKHGVNDTVLRQLKDYVDDWELGFDCNSLTK